MSEQQLTTLEDRIAARVNPSVTKDIRLRPTGAIAFNNADEMMEVAKLMAIAQVAVPKHCRGNPGVCLAVVIRAAEWEMSPFAVAEKTYVVNDRISFEAQLVNAVILRRAPIKGRLKVSYSGEGNTRKCKVWATLTDGDTVEYESPTFSTIPTKNSPLWKGDPDQQLFYYSSRAMCRRHFPDVLLGVYTPDESAQLAHEAEPAKPAIGRLPVSEVVIDVASVPTGAPVDAAPVEPVPPLNNEPDPGELLQDIASKMERADVSEKRLTKALIELQYIEPSEKLAALDATKLGRILDGWEEIEAKLNEGK